MDITAFIIIPILGNLFLTYMIFEFMNKIDRNIYKKKSVYIATYILYSITVTAISFLGNSFLNISSLLLGVVLIGYFLYNNTKIYLLYYIIYTICLLFLDVLLNIIIPVTSTLVGVYFSTPQFYIMFSVIVIRLIEYIYTKIFTMLINKRNAKKITFKQYIRNLIVPSFSIVYMFTLIMYLQIYAGIEELLLFILNIILILILNIYMTYVYDSMAKNNELENELNLYQQQTNLQYKYYDDLEKKYNESRKLIHDIRNHLHTIEDLYSMNDINSSKSYTEDIHQMLNELNQKYYTSNKVLNIILNDKFQSIKATNISLDYRIGDVSFDFMRDIDITTVFANLLDNAIESASDVYDNSYISLDIDKFNDFVVINIQNSMKGKIIKKNNIFKSTKKNHEGLGIGNITKTIEEYNGSIVIDYDENVFKINIIIPI